VNVLVVGMGEVGRHVVRQLSEHDVTIIDTSSEALRRAEELFDARIVQGHGASPQVLRDARVETADLFVAVTDVCELNIVACVQAKAMGATRTIARVMNPAYFESPRGITADMFGIDIVINPLFQIAADIRRLVRSSAAVSVRDFADHLIESVHLTVEMDAPVIGRPLKDVRLPEQTLIVAILRDEDFIIPGGNDAILPGDDVVVVGRTSHILDIEKSFARRRRGTGKRAVIVGGGVVAMTVAQSLEIDGFHCVIIERDRGQCDLLVRQLDRTVVLNADGTNPDVLREEGVATSDVFIAVSDEDEVNLMASVLAKDLDARRCIALVHRIDYQQICERLGIDVTLSPRLTVAKQVSRYMTESGVVQMEEVLDGRGRFVEFLVGEGARVADVPLAEARFPRGALVCAVLTEGGAVVPRGDHVIRAGEHVLVFFDPEVGPSVERMFASGIGARGA